MKGMFKRARKKGDNNERLCIGCRRLRQKHELLRIAVFKDGRVVVDEAKKLGGRGVYVCFVADCVTAATKKKSWSQAFKKPVTALGGLLNQLKRHTLWMSGDLTRLW